MWGCRARHSLGGDDSDQVMQVLNIELKEFKAKTYAKDWQKRFTIGFAFAHQGAIECTTKFRYSRTIKRGEILNNCGYVVRLGEN